MPMIDVMPPPEPFPRRCRSTPSCGGEELTAALPKAEGVLHPGPTHTNNTGAYIHRLPPSAVHTAAQGDARTVRPSRRPQVC